MAHSVQARTRNLIARFGHYVSAFDADPAFSPEQLKAHQYALARRSAFESAREAATDQDFARVSHSRSSGRHHKGAPPHISRSRRPNGPTIHWRLLWLAASRVANGAEAGGVVQGSRPDLCRDRGTDPTAAPSAPTSLPSRASTQPGPPPPSTSVSPLIRVQENWGASGARVKSGFRCIDPALSGRQQPGCPQRAVGCAAMMRHARPRAPAVCQ